jgi:hypothetical protein
MKLQNIQLNLVVKEVAKVFEVVESSILSNCKGINSQNFARKVAIYVKNFAIVMRDFWRSILVLRMRHQ